MHAATWRVWLYAQNPIARAFTDARVMRIYGGTSEIMILIIGRDLLNESPNSSLGTN